MKLNNTDVKIRTEYYTVAMSDKLNDLIVSYKKVDSILSTLDDRKTVLFLVNSALEDKIEISTDQINLSRTKDIKLKKTKLIEKHFNEINERYNKFGVSISSRQYFHRLILNYLNINIEKKQREFSYE